MIIGAHSTYPPHYVSALVGWLHRSGADAVGGVCRTRPASPAPAARAIALGLAHPFGVGNSFFRIGTREARWVDTVPFGCYRRNVFDRVGLFDEELVRNQDDEFNLRLLRAGGRLLLVPDVASEYYARRSLRALARMFYQYGFFKPVVARKVGGILTARQLVPPVFVLATATAAALAPFLSLGRVALASILGLYAGALLGFALAAVRREGLSTAAWLPAVFATLHAGYGFGFLRGALAIVRQRSVRSSDPASVPLSR